MQTGWMRAWLVGIVLLHLACGGDDDVGADAGPMDAAVGDASSDATSVGDAGAVLPPEPSAGCGAGRATYAVGSAEGTLLHDGAPRTFRVRLPPSYDDVVPAPLVLMFHGGGGSGLQLEQSAEMNPVADREGFVVVYADGTGRISTWNAGGCCGGAVRDAVDDVGFVHALVDHLGEEVCVDQRRVYASGMSNGAMLSHRLACEASDRIAAIAPVAGLEMSPTCTPPQPVPVLQVQGTDDRHVPWEGGVGCGLAGVESPPVAATMDGWRQRNGCTEATSVLVEMGDGSCAGFDGCSAGGETVLCTIVGGGHSWPGGVPRPPVIDCPGDGEQSTTFDASEQIWAFFARHARP